MSCIAATWTRRLGTRLCCASRDGCLHIFGLSLANNDLFELQCRVPVSLPVGFSPRPLIGMVGGRRLALVERRKAPRARPVVATALCYPGSNGGGGSRDAPTVSAALFGVQPLPPGGSDQGGGRAVCLALPSSETVLIGSRKGGGGGAAVVVEAAGCMIQQQSLNPRRRWWRCERHWGPFVHTPHRHRTYLTPSHPSGRHLNTCCIVRRVAIPPHMLPNAHLRIYDLSEGTHVQSVPLPTQAIAAATAEAAGDDGSGNSERPSSSRSAAPTINIASCGPHLIVVSIGKLILLLPPAPNGLLDVETDWLRRLAVRAWDATLVERHMRRHLESGKGDGGRNGNGDGDDEEAMDISDGASRGAANTTTTTSHPLAKSITRLSEGFSPDAPRIAADGRSEQAVNGLDDFLGQQLHQLRGGATLEGVATACAHARRLVQRVCDEAFMMYPQLAPRSHEEIAHGAGGVELLSMVERSAYGALRRTLVSLHVEASPETARKYQVQLRLLARLTPEKLGLPSAFCGSSSNSTAGSKPSRRFYYWPGPASTITPLYRGYSSCRKRQHPSAACNAWLTCVIWSLRARRR